MCNIIRPVASELVVPSISCCISLHQDLLRTLPTNICFRGPESPGVARLRRVLRALASHCPDTGYCQGMGVVAATLLLFCPEVWRSIDSV